MGLPRRLLPSLQELVAFEAAGRYGSFTQAAEELNLTQSAVSKQIRQVEEALNIPLFERVRGGVVLTSAGRAYFTATQEVLRRLETSTHAAVASAGSETVLNLAVLPTFATRWLIPRLPQFASLGGGTVNLATRLEPFAFEETNFDLAIHYGAPHWPNAHSEYLFDEVVAPVASPSYLGHKPLHRPKDLQRATLLQLSTRPAQWADWFQNVGVDCAHPLRGPLFDQFSMTVQAAIASLGVALVPLFLVQDEVAAGKLVILFDRPVRGPSAYYAVVPSGKRHDPLVLRFLAWLLDQASTVRSENRATAPQSSRCGRRSFLMSARATNRTSISASAASMAR